MRSVLVLFLISLATACSKTSVSYTNNPNAPDYLHNRPVGASANEILSATKYSSLKIEVQYMTGFVPDAAALNNLQTFLNTLVNKPGGITIVTREIPGSASTTLSVDNVVNIEKENRTAFTNNSEIALYILFTNGNYTDNNVLGVAYKNTSVVLFGKKIND